MCCLGGLRVRCRLLGCRLLVGYGRFGELWNGLRRYVFEHSALDRLKLTFICLACYCSNIFRLTDGRTDGRTDGTGPTISLLRIHGHLLVLNRNNPLLLLRIFPPHTHNPSLVTSILSLATLYDVLRALPDRGRVRGVHCVGDVASAF